MDLAALIPLAVASALVPVQVVITVLLLRSPRGPLPATAWVAGTATVRIIQGIVVGWLLGSGEAVPEDGTGPGVVASVLLLVVAVLLYAGALKQLMGGPDDDAPPPRWMAAFEGVAPARAYLLGCGIQLASVKLWVFTLGAIGVIEASASGVPAMAAWYLAFVTAALAPSLVLLAFAWLRPERAAGLLVRVSDALTRFNRAIVITLGLVFGTWFLLKSLGGLGIL